MLLDSADDLDRQRVDAEQLRGAQRLLGGVPNTNTITHTAPCAVLVVRTC